MHLYCFGPLLACFFFIWRGRCGHLRRAQHMGCTRFDQIVILSANSDRDHTARMMPSLPQLNRAFSLVTFVILPAAQRSLCVLGQ